MYKESEGESKHPENASFGKSRQAFYRNSYRLFYVGCGQAGSEEFLALTA
jgi:hypothetical protein